MPTVTGKATNVVGGDASVANQTRVTFTLVGTMNGVATPVIGFLGNTEIVTSSFVLATAGTGAWTIAVPSNLDPTLTPSNTYYRVTEEPVGAPAKTYYVQVPNGAGPYQAQNILVQPTSVSAPAVGLLAANNLSDLTNAAIARANLDIDAITSVADVNKIAVATDRIIAYTSLTAARTVTLPAANAVNPGQWVLIADYSNSASATNTISIVAAGSDTIVNNQAIASAGGSRRFISDGISKWILEEATRLRASANLLDVQSTATSRTNLGVPPLAGPFAPSSTGALATVRFVGGTTAGAPVTGTFAVGDYVIDQTGIIWICTVAGTPGTWQQASGSHMDVYTTPGTFTWTKPQGAVSVRVILLAPGGGGGAGGRFASGTVSVGGGGGGGGGYVDVLLPATDIASTMTVVVGAGGAGATGQTADTSAGAAGSAGASTTFGTSPALMRATNGAFGNGGGAGVGGAGGSAQGGTGISAAGGSASTTGAVGPAGGSVNGWGGAGGGAGGGIATTPANTAGGTSGAINWQSNSTGSAGTSGGGTGGNGNNAGRTNAGGGGGGGGSNIASAGGPGGNGGLGAGGGGGGASLNGNTSGAGGNGGNGFAIIVTVF